MTGDQRLTAAEWRDVPGYEGLYAVSDDGQVMSLPRVNRYGRRIRERILKPAAGTDGRPGVALHKDNGQRTHKIQVLVCLAFHGPRPEGREARHLDGNYLNNHATNLAWGTHRENENDKVRHGTRIYGSKAPHAKLTERLVAEIRERYAAGELQKPLAAEFGISCSTVSLALRGKRWRHVAGEAPGVWPHKLTEDQVLEIRERYAAGGISQRALAAEYGVVQGTVSRILRGRGWRHVQ